MPERREQTTDLRRLARQRIDVLTKPRPPVGLRTNLTEVAPLSTQTPGLDKTRKIRDAAIRGAAWARERPLVVASIAVGFLALGGYAWLFSRKSRNEVATFARPTSRLPAFLRR